jgi:hypothetical protein
VFAVCPGDGEATPVRCPGGGDASGELAMTVEVPSDATGAVAGVLAGDAAGAVAGELAGEVACDGGWLETAAPWAAAEGDVACAAAGEAAAP